MGVSRSAFVLKDQCDSVSVNSPFLGYKFAKIRELHLLFLIFYASYLYFTNFSRTEICSFFSHSTILKCLGMLFLTNFLGLNWACHHLRKTKREKQVFFFYCYSLYISVLRGMFSPHYLLIHDSFPEEKLRYSHLPLYLCTGGGEVTCFFGEFWSRNYVHIAQLI